MAAEQVFRQRHGAELDRLQEGHKLPVDLRAVAQRINIRLAGSQGVIHHDPAIDLDACATGQGRFRTQTGGGNHRVDLNMTIAIERGTNTARGLFQRQQLRIQQQMHTHLR